MVVGEMRIKGMCELLYQKARVNESNIVISEHSVYAELYNRLPCRRLPILQLEVPDPWGRDYKLSRRIVYESHAAKRSG